MSADHGTAAGGRGEPPDRLLDGYTAVELAGVEGQMCGRILADLGMEVVKVEPLGGDPVRRRPPLHGEVSLVHSFLNSGKKSVALDLESSRGAALLRQLVRKADVFLTTYGDATLHDLGLGLDELESSEPDLVVTSLTGFGRAGPYREYACPDIVGMAMGGLMYISGDPDLPPVRGPETQAYYFASIYAAQGTLFALWRRVAGGTGGRVDVSVQEAMATTDQLVRMYAADGTIVRRRGSQHEHVVPARVFPTSDGYICLFVGEHHWPRLLELWVDHPAELDDPSLRPVATRKAHAETVNRHVEEWLGSLGTEEVLRLMASKGIPCTRVNTMADFLTDEQSRHRQILGGVEHPGLGSVLEVTLPAAVNGARQQLSPAPVLGEHTGKVLARLLDMTPDDLDILAAQGIVEA